MPSQSRAQRRQKNTRQAPRANTPAARPLQDSSIDQAESETPESAFPVAPAIELTPRPAARQSRQARRPVARPLPEPVDYSQDYVIARSDLVKIAIWSILLFGGMIAIKLTGLV